MKKETEQNKIEKCIKAGYKVLPVGVNSFDSVSFTFKVEDPTGYIFDYPGVFFPNRRTKMKIAGTNIQEKMKEIYLAIYEKTIKKK